jgi:molecular chaperone HtpG
MSQATTVAPEAHEFKAEVQQLLNILVHSLYTDKEIFLRELISNASDALNRIQFEMLTNHDVLDPEAELAIYIEADEEAKTLTIRDTGDGMTREELINNLGTIAKSGAADFLAKVKEAKGNASNIIGQFGVGFYSVFMAAEEVELTTRSYRQEAEAVKWISRGSETYTIEPADKPDRGTTIVIKLNDESHEFASPYRIENAIKKHSDFIDFPIHLITRQKKTEDDQGEEETEDRVVNQQTPLWRQPPADIDDEKYNNFYRQQTLDFEEPLARLHLSADAPVQVNAILFIPAKREGSFLSLRKEPGLKLYSRNVLIQEYNTNLLPNHFRFVQGVVDSEDVPLSVSRESIQSSRAIERLKNLLTRRVVRTLEDLAKDEPEKYKKFWHEFSPFMKEGIATDFSARDSLSKLLRFPSSTTAPDELVSLQDYVDNMPDAQDKIYYVLADSVTSANHSPHMDYFKKRNIQVLYMVDPLDGFMLTGLQEFAGHQLQNVEGAELEADEEEKAAQEEAKEKLPDDRFAQVIARFKSVLTDRVEDVREAKHLSDSPVRLVSPEGTPGQEMHRIRRILDQDYEIPKKVLEINRGHPIIQNLAGLIGGDTALADMAIEQLFDSALLSEGLHPDPAEMLPRIQQFIELATESK